MSIKRSPADKAFSDCVREAADYTCAWSGKKFERGNAQGLHCSHHYSRSHRNIRWDEMNACALSFAAHKRYGSDPIEGVAWLEEYLGEGVMEILKEKKAHKIKIPKAEEKLIASHYKAELAKLLERRESGETGKLNFLSYF